MAELSDGMSCEIRLHIVVSTPSGNRPEFARRPGIVAKMSTGAGQDRWIRGVARRMECRGPTRPKSAFNRFFRYLMMRRLFCGENGFSFDFTYLTSSPLIDSEAKARHGKEL
jgi:hypothetical protein